MKNGIELPLLYATAGMGLSFTGPGRYSLDAVVGLAPLWDIRLEILALAVGIIGGLGALAVRRPVAAC